MNRKLMKALAVVSVLALSSIGLAQDGTGTIGGYSPVQILGTLAAIIWFILFARWGGFRYLY